MDCSTDRGGSRSSQEFWRARALAKQTWRPISGPMGKHYRTGGRVRTQPPKGHWTSTITKEWLIHWGWSIGCLVVIWLDGRNHTEGIVFLFLKSSPITIKHDEPLSWYYHYRRPNMIKIIIHDWPLIVNIISITISKLPWTKTYYNIINYDKSPLITTNIH